MKYLIQPDTMIKERRCVIACEKPFCTSSYDNLPHILASNEQYVPIGSVEFVNEFARLKGITIPENITYPQEILHFLKRKVWQDKFSNVDDTLFVKPVKTKIFTGGIKKKLTEIVSSDEDVWVSDPLDIEAEFRYYVMDRKILGSSRYDDKDNDCFPNEDVVRQIIEQYKNQPAGYAIDIGVVGGETILIEVNDGWALGYYPWGDFTRHQYVDLITARWKQIEG